GIAANNGILRIDPQLVTNTIDGLWRPSLTSPALGTAGGAYTNVIQDFEGQLRPPAKDIGCDQSSAAPVLYPPLTPVNVGPLWMRTNGTFLTWPRPADIIYGTPLGAAQLNASANAAGTFIYSPPAETLLPAGSNQTLTVVFTPYD